MVLHLLAFTIGIGIGIGIGQFKTCFDFGINFYFGINKGITVQISDNDMTFNPCNLV